jgi:ribonuclease P protein component
MRTPPTPPDTAPHLPRLLKRAEFQAAAGHGRRFRSSVLTIQVLDRVDAPGVRLGLTASRKVGTAVERNRARRKLREAAREALAGAAAHADIVLVARPETIGAPYLDLVRDIRLALTKARPQKPR